MKIDEIYKLYSKYFLVDTDTRNIREHTLFFALKGENFNGNKFAHTALEQGAAFAIIDEIEFKINDKTIVVDNVLETLQQLANYHRLQLSLSLIHI